MGEIGSLLSLIIQGRKIEFDSVAFDYSYVVQSWHAFQRKMSIDELSPFNPDISLPVNQTPDLRFNQKPFDVPSHASHIYDSRGREGPILLQIAPLETCKRHDISRLCAVYR